MRGPQVEAATGLPSPGDGVRGGSARRAAEREGHVPTAVKAEFVRRLVAAGLPIVETTSFVPGVMGTPAG